jgi:hypothetical protein
VNSSSSSFSPCSRLPFFISLCFLYWGSSCLTPPPPLAEVSPSLAPPPAFQEFFPLQLQFFWLFQKTQKPDAPFKVIYGLHQRQGSSYQMLIETEKGHRESASFHQEPEGLTLVRGLEQNRHSALFLPSTLNTGYSWKWREGKATILEKEDIQVPAGSFRALPIQYEQEIDDLGKKKQVLEKIWFVPQVGWAQIEQRLDGVLISSQVLLYYGEASKVLPQNTPKTPESSP